MYLPYAKSPHSQTEIRHWVRKKFIPTGDVWLAKINSEDIGVLATSVADSAGEDSFEEGSAGDSWYNG